MKTRRLHLLRVLPPFIDELLDRARIGGVEIDKCPRYCCNLGNVVLVPVVVVQRVF